MMARTEPSIENVKPGDETAESKAERLAYANREGKYADPTVPPPPGIVDPTKGRTERFAYANRLGKYTDPSVPPPPGGGGNLGSGDLGSSVIVEPEESIAKRVGAGILLAGPIGAAIGALTGKQRYRRKD